MIVVIGIIVTRLFAIQKWEIRKLSLGKTFSMLVYLPFWVLIEVLFAYGWRRDLGKKLNDIVAEKERIDISYAKIPSPAAPTKKNE
jgi:uncharacterized membrane protein YGL010W